MVFTVDDTVRNAKGMEVHPPEHGIHSWRDFFVHMGTITLGLLIAISLEQSVEWVHHREQRNQIIEEMRLEADANVLICRRLIDQRLRPESKILEEWGDALRTLPVENDHVVVRVPEALRALDGQIDGKALLPTLSVWSVAKQSELVPLLPGETIQFFDYLNKPFSWMDSMAHAEIEMSAEYEALVLSISGHPLGTILPVTDTLRITDEQRRRMLEMLANIQVHNQGLMVETSSFQSISESIRAGTMSIAEYKNWLRSHPREDGSTLAQARSND